MKIRHKLLCILSVPILLGIVLFTIYFDRRESQQHLESEIASWRNVAKGIGRTWNTTMLYTGSDNLARDQFFNQKKGNDLLAIELKRNQRFTRINSESSPYVSTELEKRVIAEGEPVFKVLSKNNHLEKRLLTLAPLKAIPACIPCHQKMNNHPVEEGDVIAVISLVSSLKALDEQLASDRTATFFSLLCIFFVILVVSYLTINRATRPIINLTKASEAIAAGNLEVRIPAKSKDELGVLGNTFNLMVEKIKESRETLESYSKQLEERARELNLTALFVDLNPDPVLRIDMNGIILQCNPAARQVFTDKKMVGKSWLKVCPDICQDLLPILLRTSEKRSYYQSEARVNEKDYLFTYKLIPDYDAIHVYGISITELKRAEKQLRKLSQAVEQSPASVVITDTLGTIDYVNPKFTQVTGYTAKEAIGQNPNILNSGKQPTEYYQELWNTITAGKTWRGEFCNIKKNSELYWESASISPIRNSKGSITHYLAIKEDITERKHAEAELQKAKEAAEAANLAKGEFLTNMSHEIRTPLNAIIGMTELTLETNLDSEQQGFLDVVLSSSEGLLSLINDILDFSKIEAGQMELENTDFNLREIVEGVAEIFSMRAEAKGIELLCYIEPEIPKWVVGDPTRLRQILVNLTGNAIKFTEQGEVVVKCGLWNADFGKPILPQAEIRNPKSEIRNLKSTSAQICLHFVVRDTGIGISKDNLQKIFEKFSQADSSTTRKFGGTGLGLNISKSLIELMGGEMWAESHEGSGSTFQFRLNLPIGEGCTDCFDSAYHDYNNTTILVVDDNETNRFILRKTLTAWDFQVKEAQSGPQALAILHDTNTQIKLVILDQLMPNMDGPELALKIKKSQNLKGIKIIMLSSVSNLNSGLKQKLAIDRYINKPVKQSKLFDIIMEVLQYQKPKDINSVKSVKTDQNKITPIPHRILLVEDNLDNQKLAKMILEKAGYVVDLAENGQLAVEAVHHFRYDLILMDVFMPVMDGFDATKQIRALERSMKENRTPIIALTAHAIEGYREKCLRHDMDDFITKPVKKKNLLSIINNWLDTRPTIMVVDDSSDNLNLINSQK